MKLGRGILSKRGLFFILCSGFILLTGSYSFFPPLQGMEAISWAQAPSEGQPAQPPDSQGSVKPEPAPSPMPPQGESGKASPLPGRAADGPGVTIDLPLARQPKGEPEQPGDANTSRTAQSPDQLPGQTSPAGRAQPGLRRPLPGSAQPASVPSSHAQSMVTLNFDDADVFTIIQTIYGTVLKVNYVVDPRIKGRVTFRAVAPVPQDNVLPLMEVILRLNGIGVVEDNGLYRLVPISDISKEPSPVNFGRDPEKIQTTGKAILQVVPMLYVQSSDVVKLITPFASTNAVLIDVPKGNQIVIVDTDASVKRLLKLVDIFDNEKLQKTKPQVFVYSVQNSKARDIATVLQQTFLGARPLMAGAAGTGAYGAAATTGGQIASSTTTTGGTAMAQGAYSSYSQGAYSPYSTQSGSSQMLVADFTRFIPDDVTNSIIILSTPEEYALIRQAIDKIDTIPRQVVIEGLIAQVTLTDNLSMGLSAYIRGSFQNMTIGGGMNASQLTGDITQPSGSGLSLFGVDTGGRLQFLIQALAEKSQAKLLATPHILVSDNREAKIQVGQQVPLVTSETYGSTTVAPQRTIQYRDIGIILKCKPRVNEGGLVSLELYQEVSTFETRILFANETQIILDNNNASTTVVVQDGQTIVIGGLIREDTTKSRSGIPFLSKIPFIGWLFGSTVDNKQRTEIIILLTPRVVKNRQEASAVSNSYIDSIAGESKGITKQELIKEKPQK